MSELDIGLLVGFVILTVVNVVLQTARTIVTVKGGVFWSSTISAVAFGFYTIVIVWTICDLPLWMKASITAVANFAGTYLVKVVEGWMRKDRLWLVDVVLTGNDVCAVKCFLDEKGIKYTELPISGANEFSELFHIYSNTKDESRVVRDMLKAFHARYFASESKSL